MCQGWGGLCDDKYFCLSTTMPAVPVMRGWVDVGKIWAAIDDIYPSQDKLTSIKLTSN